MSDNIIKFTPGMLPIKPKKHRVPCDHKHVLAVQQTRMLECQKCKAIIDPFDFLFTWAIHDQHLQRTRKALIVEVERIRKDLTEWERQERNIKARIRRVKVTRA